MTLWNLAHELAASLNGRLRGAQLAGSCTGDASTEFNKEFILHMPWGNLIYCACEPGGGSGEESRAEEDEGSALQRIVLSH